MSDETNIKSTHVNPENPFTEPTIGERERLN